MDQFGPAWVNAEFNAFYYASYWVTPLVMAFAAMSRTWKHFWTFTAISVAMTCAASWLAWNQMWALRAESASTVVERDVMEAVQRQGAAVGAIAAFTFAVVATMVWAAGAALVFKFRPSRRNRSL